MTDIPFGAWKKLWVCCLDFVALRVQIYVMSTWKSKLFCDNRFNFCGWIFAGSAVIGVSLWCVLKAIQGGASSSPTCLLLGAIYFIVFGHFCIALQNYCARVAKNIEAEDAKKNDKEDETTST